MKTIMLLEEFIGYKSGSYTVSDNMYDILRTKQIMIRELELDTSKPILSKFVYDRSKMSPKVRRSIEKFEEWLERK
jgi:hypothetical protein